MIARILSILHARNIEFLRDRSALGWNILLPVLLVVGMGVIFSGDGRAMFKVAVLQESEVVDVTAHPFLQTRYIDFYAVSDLDDALAKLSRHQMDMLISPADQPPQFWVNESAPKGYILEKLIASTGRSDFSRGNTTLATIAGCLRDASTLTQPFVGVDPVSGNSQVVVQATSVFAGTTCGGSPIAEAGMFNEGTTLGEMFARNTFGPVPALGATETLTIGWNFTFTDT